MERLRFRRILLAVAAGAAGLATISTMGGGTASAATVNQPLSCGLGGNQTASAVATAPASVEQGKTYKVTIAAAGSSKADGATISNMTTSFTAPAGTTPVPGSAKVVPGTGSANLGTVSVSISGSTIQAKASGPVPNGATFTGATIEFELTATGAPGTVLNVRYRQNAAYTLTAAGFNVSCNATTPLANLTATTITAAPTTTTVPGSTTSTTTTTAPLTTTSTTAPQPTVTYETWSPSVGCGTVQSVVSPANTVEVQIIANGGRGGRSGSQASSATVPGGAGAQVSAFFPASPGQSFAAVVGCNGNNGGGYNNNQSLPDGYSRGGGTGRGSIIAGQAGASGGQGGASSAVCSGAVCRWDNGGVAPLVVAGGGGGGGVSNCAGTPSGPGGAAGLESWTAIDGGTGPSGTNGNGGGNSGSGSGGGAGGSGGVNSTDGAPSGGSNGDGSGGLGVNVVGGGGGGGYVGGGAGGNSATGCKGAGGGGGGSSWVKSTSTSYSFGTAETNGVTIRFKRSVPPVICPRDYVPFDNADQLVAYQTQDFKGRAPTIAEQDLWIGGINRCELSADELITSLLPGSQSTDDARLVRLYLAYFKRPPDPDGFAFWSNHLAQGRSLITAARKFSESPEFKRTYGELDNGEFVDLVYLNVLGRISDPEGREYWVTRLDDGSKNRGDVMITFSESSENTRRKVDHVGVFRLFRTMRNAFPSRSAFNTLIDPIVTQGKVLNDAANAIRTSEAYAIIANP